MTAAAEDPRVDIVLKVQEVHGTSYAASRQAPNGEGWRCRCGEAFAGDGAIKAGRHHHAVVLLAALDAGAPPEPLLCPECENGKPINCVGEALDVSTDSFVPCGGAR